MKIISLLALLGCSCVSAGHEKLMKEDTYQANFHNQVQQETLEEPLLESTNHSFPVKVFILAGQSNMVGHASVDHLVELIDQDDEFREVFWDEEKSDFRQSDNVYIDFLGRSGPLSVGYGYVDSHKDYFGPEVSFGLKMGEAFEKVLLIKTAWGGRDLAVDFRPPSSGFKQYLDRKGNKLKRSRYGQFYRRMINAITESLDHIHEVIPDYNKNAGFEISGVVWFQGYNDALEWNKVDEYQWNLANLIRDLRYELDDPELPFIVGELGMAGLQAPTRDSGGVRRHHAMRLNAEAATFREEFVDNTLYVPTASYLVENGKHFERRYHYYGRADTYYYIGNAFGNGMLELVGSQSDLDSAH